MTVKLTDLKVEVLGSFAFVFPARLRRMERGRGMGSNNREVTEGEKKRGKFIKIGDEEIKFRVRKLGKQKLFLQP